MRAKRQLISSEEYKNLTPERKAQICNGAGAKDDWRNIFIPNTLWGLGCTPVFDIHDFDYSVGFTYEDKCKADANMLVNLIRHINNYGGFLRIARRYRAMTYYDFVVEMGEDAFFQREKGNLHLHIDVLGKNYD